MSDVEISTAQRGARDWLRGNAEAPAVVGTATAMAA